MQNECIKLAQFKSRVDWVSKEIYWELRERLNNFHTDKGNMPRPESVLEKET